MAGVSEFPMRVKCATLAWHTYQNARGGGQNAATRANATAKSARQSELAMQSALTPEELDAFTSKLVTALKTVYRPGNPGGYL